MSGIDTVDDYVALSEAGDLNLRVWYGFFEGEQDRIFRADEKRSAVAEAMADLPGGKGPLVELGYAKTVLDGVLSTRTAYLLEDYADRTGWQGEPFQSVEDLTGKIVEANESGFPIAVHAIGDGAVQMTLDAFAAADTASPQPNRIEHIEVADPADVSRFDKLGVAASMQPNHATGTIGKYITERLGEHREQNAYVWNDLLEAGVPLVLGSDWPTSPLSPLTQLDDAIFRESPFGLGDGPWHPEQALTFDQALHAYTQAGADLTAWGDEIGSISKGKWADFVVLDGSIPEPVDRSIRDLTVAATYVAGHEVYRKP